MKYLICSDIHGNLPAFEEILKKEKDFDSFICLGDLVNYGPWGNECVDLALSLPNSQIIMGNHEEYFISGSYLKNDLVNLFFNQTYPSFTKISQISSFPKSIILDKFILTHTINNQYIYPDAQIQLDNNYIIGHSHHQFKYENNGFILYNVGSVGQNRKHINVINYLNFDSNENLFIFKSIIYNINLVIDQMTNLNYPKQCVDYYKQKLKL